jgi:hypothetical protein
VVRNGFAVSPLREIEDFPLAAKTLRVFATLQETLRVF